MASHRLARPRAEFPDPPCTRAEVTSWPSRGRYRRDMARIGPVELLILVAGLVGVAFLVRLGVRGSQPAPPSNGPVGRGSADPTRRHELRWWDGQAWSPSVSDNGVLGHDPVE